MNNIHKLYKAVPGNDRFSKVFCVKPQFVNGNINALY